MKADLEAMKEAQNKTLEMVATMQAAMLNQANVNQIKNENSSITVSNNIQKKTIIYKCL